MIAYTRFDPPHKIEEYQGQPGHEVGKLALPAYAYEAIADSKVTGNPAQYVVTGRRVHEDGRFYLDLAVSKAWLETATQWREDERGRLRWLCPVCQQLGTHLKKCSES